MTIRRLPEDFQVVETLTPAARAGVGDRPAAFAVYELAKTNLTTPQATALLARRLGVKPGAVDHAGLKDRHALTLQHVTVRMGDPARGSPGNVRAGPAPAPPPRLTDTGWSARFLGWSTGPAEAAWIGHNRFTLVVRDLSPQQALVMDDAFIRLRRGPAGSLWFVNYFGDQRFGSARHGQGFVARLLIAGDSEGALRLALATPARKDHRTVKEFRRRCAEHWGHWPELARDLPRCPDRRAVEHLAQRPGDFLGAFGQLPHFFQEMSFHAYQSHLWNLIAAHLIQELATVGGAGDDFPPPSRQQAAGEAGVFHPGDAGGDPRASFPTWTIEDPFGPMTFADASTLATEHLAIDLPLLGRGTVLREPWAGAARAALAAEGLAGTEALVVAGLRRPAFGEASRPLLAEATGAALGEPVADELSAKGRRLRREVRFSLPRGAYATVLLRAMGQ